MRWIPAFILLLALAAASAPAAALSWPGRTTGTWRRPAEDLSGGGPERVPFSSLAVHVDRSGEYTFSVDPFEFEAVLFLYAGRFDPRAPLDGLVAAGPEITFPVVAGVIYHLVTSGRGPDDQGEFTGSFDGEGNARLAACFIGDEPYFYDDLPLSAQSVQGGLFCVVVTGRKPDGEPIFGRAVGHRSDDTALFWLFSRENWELLVKVLDGCNLGGHYWVFMSASTNVELEVEVTSFVDFSVRRYHNPAGRPFRTITDTEAFACP